MNNKVKIKKVNDIIELENFLKKIDSYFPIALSEKVNLKDYAKKVMDRGISFFAISDNKIIGVCIGYANDIRKNRAFISVIAVLPEYRNLKVGHKLILAFKKYARENNMKSIILFVNKENKRAIEFYRKNGFKKIDEKANYEYNITMKTEIKVLTNILLTSVGRRGYLVKYFKEALGNTGKVYVSNSSDISPAFNYADESVVSPLIYDKGYVDFLLRYCKEKNIKAIISLFDIDLPILSKNKQRFKEQGIEVIVSDVEIIDICNDKWKTFNFLKENNFNIVHTYIKLQDAIQDLRKNKIKYPVIVKPRWGMGSISVMEAENEDELRILYKKAINKIKNSYLKYESANNIEEAILIQEKINGKEHGLDVINDLSGKYQTTIVKEKYAMRAGETDCAKVINNDILKKLGEKIRKKLCHIGNMDVDVFLVNNEAYILEMNARFGGGYPFSHMAGVNLPKAIVSWLKNQKLEEDILKVKKFDTLFHKDINIVELKRKQ